MGTSKPYHGPVVVLTREEAKAILPYLSKPSNPQVISAKDKIRTALGSDPVWRKPTQ